MSKLQMPCRHTGRPETTRIKLATISGVVLAATFGGIRGKDKLDNIHDDSTAETNENTHTLQLKQGNNKESHTSPLKETSLQNRNNAEKMKLLANQYCTSKTPRTVKTKPRK